MGKVVNRRCTLCEAHRGIRVEVEGGGAHHGAPRGVRPEGAAECRVEPARRDRTVDRAVPLHRNEGKGTAEPDSGASQMLGAALPAFRRGEDWPASVRLVFGAMFAFGAAEPAYTQLGAIEVFAGGAGTARPCDRRPRGAVGARLPAGAADAPNRRRGDRRGDLRADLRPGARQGPGEPAGDRAAGDLRDALPFIGAEAAARRRTAGARPPTAGALWVSLRSAGKSQLAGRSPERDSNS